MLMKKSLLAGSLALTMVTTAQAVVVDTYTRADGTNLGSTEVGNLPYTEFGTIAGEADEAHIAGGKLVVSGEPFGDPIGTNPGVAEIGLPNGGFADIQLGVDVSWNGASSGTTLNNTAFVEFRRRSNALFTNSASSAGLIHVELFANGNIVVREKLGDAIATLKNTAYDSAGSVIALAGINAFSAGTERRYEFDLNGNMLAISVDGNPIINHTLDATLPASEENLVALGKNRWTSGADTAQDAVFDNLSLDPVPEPASLALLGLGGLMMLRRKRQ